MTFKPLAAAAAIALAVAGLAHADETGPKVKLSGYGTVAGTVAGEDLGFRRTVSMSKGSDKEIDIGQDSRVGVQANVDFQSGLSAVGQLVAKRRITGAVAGADKDFDLAVEWLYGQYQILPSLNVRLGRMGLPLFLLSDSLNVGYAAPWIHAPVHVYATSPMEQFDGAQLNWRVALGGVNLTAQVGYGKTKAWFFEPSMGVPAAIDTDHLANVNLTAEYGDWLGRVGRSKTSSPLGALTVKDTYDSVGVQYDNGQALVMAEFARRDQNGQASFGGAPLITGKYAYVAGGWRFGKLLPLLVVSQAKQKPYVFGAGAVVPTNEKGLGASLRYDVAPNVSLKFQLDRFNAKDGMAFINARRTDSSKVNVYTAGLDFVF